MIIGHSFVQGLKQHLEHRTGVASERKDFPQEVAKVLKVDDAIQEVFLWGEIGALVSSFDNFIEERPEKILEEIKPNMVLIELSSNDLAQGFQVERITQAIIILMEKIIKWGALSVGYLSVIPRQGNLPKISIGEFEVRRKLLCRSMEKSITGGNMFVFRHKGFVEKQVGNRKVPLEISEWSKDKIHPNKPLGRTKYIESLKTALLRGFVVSKR